MLAINNKYNLIIFLNLIRPCHYVDHKSILIGHVLSKFL